MNLRLRGPPVPPDIPESRTRPQPTGPQRISSIIGGLSDDGPVRTGARAHQGMYDFRHISLALSYGLFFI